MPLDLDALQNQTVSRSLLDPAQLREEVAALGTRWSIAGADLRLELRGKAMTKTAAAAVSAATIADEMEHHPRIVLEAAGLTLTIHTDDAKAITVIDLVFAARLERWLRDNGW